MAQNLANAMKAGDALTDRIENGDQKLLKVKRTIKHNDGSVEISEDYELWAEPMKGRDLAVVTGIVQDKARVQMNLPTSIQGKSPDMRALAEEFKKLSDQMNEKRINSIPGESEEIP